MFKSCITISYCQSISVNVLASVSCQCGKLVVLAGSLRDWRFCRVGHAGHASLATPAACFELLGVFGVHLQRRMCRM